MRKIHIGDVAVVRLPLKTDDDDRPNPYISESVCGNARAAALTAWKNQWPSFRYDGDFMWGYAAGEAQTDSFAFWYAPSFGGARPITVNEVDWESSGITP